MHACATPVLKHLLWFRRLFGKEKSRRSKYVSLVVLGWLSTADVPYLCFQYQVVLESLDKGDIYEE